MRIVTVVETWDGSCGNAFLRAFRRLGHSVMNVDPATFVPTGWSSRALRAVRRALEPALVRSLTDAIVSASQSHEAELLFVFKGRYVARRAVLDARSSGTTAVNVYPDVSFLAHGRYLPLALPAYDWIFTTKSFGLADLERELGVRDAEFLPHGFDLELHAPVLVDDVDRRRYECDVSFIGTWSPKKQRFLETLVGKLPSLRVRIWGAQWERASTSLAPWIEGRGVLGREYAKALICSRVNLGLLSESRHGASSGDLTTSRTFEIPATGSFMLHEWTPEVQQYFEDGMECVTFTDADAMVEAVEYYLSKPDERQLIADRGRARCLKSGYSFDDRAAVVLRRAQLIRSVSSATHLRPTFAPEGS